MQTLESSQGLAPACSNQRCVPLFNGWRQGIGVMKKQFEFYFSYKLCDLRQVRGKLRPKRAVRGREAKFKGSLGTEPGAR